MIISDCAIISKYSIYGLDVKRQRFFSDILAPRKIWVILKSYILTGPSKETYRESFKFNRFLEKRALKMFKLEKVSLAFGGVGVIGGGRGQIPGGSTRDGAKSGLTLTQNSS